MANNRNELAEKLEIIGGMFEIDGMNELLGKFEAGMNTVKFNAVIIQIESLLMRENQQLADKIILIKKGISEEELDKLDDAEYANALKESILTDVMGFFASSPRTAGKK